MKIFNTIGAIGATLVSDWYRLKKALSGFWLILTADSGGAYLIAGGPDWFRCGVRIASNKLIRDHAEAEMMLAEQEYERIIRESGAVGTGKGEGAKG